MPKPRQWLSSEPVVIGNPGPSIEPRAVEERFHPYPYRADSVLDGWENDHFVIRAASLRGHAHRYFGTPRQDDFAITVHNGGSRLLVAVADGVSQSPQSHVGSTTAVQYAVHVMGREVKDLDCIDWANIIEQIAWGMIQKATDVFGTEDAESAESLLATTLICAVIDAQEDRTAVVEVVSVGDSGAWILDGDNIAAIVGHVPDTLQGVIMSSVIPLPRVPKVPSVSKITLNRRSALLLGTDGFGDPLGDGSGEVGRLFAETLMDRVPSIYEFAHKLDFSRDTYDDDRTLVAVWLNASDDGACSDMNLTQASASSKSRTESLEATETCAEVEITDDMTDRRQPSRRKRRWPWLFTGIVLAGIVGVLVAAAILGYLEVNQWSITWG